MVIKIHMMQIYIYNKLIVYSNQLDYKVIWEKIKLGM